MKSCCSHAPLYRDAAGSLDQYGQEYVHGADEGKNGEAVVSDGFSGSNYSVSQAQIVFQNCFEAVLDAYTSLPGVKVPRNLQPKTHYTCHTEMVVIGIREAFTATFLGAGGCPSAIIAAPMKTAYTPSAQQSDLQGLISGYQFSRHRFLDADCSWQPRLNECSRPGLPKAFTDKSLP